MTMAIPESGDEKVRFVRATGVELNAMMERYGVTKDAVVDELIERTCWGDDPQFARYHGRRGTAKERLNAVLAALDRQAKQENKGARHAYA
jgi:hypothetical protein